MKSKILLRLLLFFLKNTCHCLLVNTNTFWLFCLFIIARHTINCSPNNASFLLNLPDEILLIIMEKLKPIDILPRMHYDVKMMILEFSSMERFLLAGDYSNLYLLVLVSLDYKIFSDWIFSIQNTKYFVLLSSVYSILHLKH